MGWSVLFPIPTGEIFLALNLPYLAANLSSKLVLWTLYNDDTRMLLVPSKGNQSLLFFTVGSCLCHLALIQSGNTTAWSPNLAPHYKERSR